MRNCLVVVLVTAVLALGSSAYGENAEGPVWDITYVRTKPNQRDAYLASLKQNTKPILEEEKKQGLILDYKIFNNLTQHDPQEWNIAIAIQYKNFAALDGFEGRELAIRDKMVGSRQAATKIFGEKLGEMREIVSTKLVQELILE